MLTVARNFYYHNEAAPKALKKNRFVPEPAIPATVHAGSRELATGLPKLIPRCTIGQSDALKNRNFDTSADVVELLLSHFRKNRQR